MGYFILYMAIGWLYISYLHKKHDRSWGDFARRIAGHRDSSMQMFVALMMAIAIPISIAVWPFGLVMRLLGGWDEVNR